MCAPHSFTSSSYLRRNLRHQIFTYATISKWSLDKQSESPTQTIPRHLIKIHTMVLIQAKERKSIIDRAHKMYLQRKYGKKVIQRQDLNAQEDAWEREWSNGDKESGRMDSIMREENLAMEWAKLKVMEIRILGNLFSRRVDWERWSRCLG